jgi:hypothetical protein
MDTKATGEESVAATQHDRPATFPFLLLLLLLLLDASRHPCHPDSRSPASTQKEEEERRRQQRSL